MSHLNHALSKYITTGIGSNPFEIGNVIDY